MRRFTELSEPGTREPNMRGQGSKFSGHFASMTLIRKDAQKELERRGRGVDQHAVEAMQAERASALGIEVRRECEVTGVVQQADDVDVEWASLTTARKTAGRIRCVAVDTGTSILIRPDACIAWASEGTSINGLGEALHR
jgi:hypothetical protein